MEDFIWKTEELNVRAIKYYNNNNNNNNKQVRRVETQTPTHWNLIW